MAKDAPPALAQAKLKGVIVYSPMASGLLTGAMTRALFINREVECNQGNVPRFRGTQTSMRSLFEAARKSNTIARPFHFLRFREGAVTPPPSVSAGRRAGR